ILVSVILLNELMLAIEKLIFAQTAISKICAVNGCFNGMKCAHVLLGHWTLETVTNKNIQENVRGLWIKDLKYFIYFVYIGFNKKMFLSWRPTAIIVLEWLQNHEEHIEEWSNKYGEMDDVSFVPVRIYNCITGCIGLFN
ncbi:hypothetical protein ACJX0J_021931, partial [Zea mays]